MTADGPITTMTPFHNVNCPHGFILSAVSGSLKVCHLPPKERLDCPWLLRKVRLAGSGSVQRLALMKEAGLLAVAVMRTMASRPRLAEEPGGDPHATAAYVTAEVVSQAKGKEEGQEVRLLELPGCSPAGGARPLLCGPGELVTCLRQVALLLPDLGNAQVTGSNPAAARAAAAAVGADGYTPLLAVGTTTMMGEDYPCLGRTYLYRVDRQQRSQADGSPADPTYSTVLLAQRDMAGGVSSLVELKGLMAVAVGKSLELFSLRPAGQRSQQTALPLVLIKVAFFDLPVLITSMALVKDFFLVGDVAKGLAFLRYNESSKLLEQLGRDFDNRDTTAAGFVINATKLLFASADASGTLRQYEYVRSHPASWNGQKLVPGGSLHCGHLVTRLLSLRLAVQDGSNRQGLLLGSLDGSLHTWLPVWDMAAAGRLAALQALLPCALPHTAGLNPRSFRRRHLLTPRSLGGGETWGSQQAPDTATPPPGVLPSLHAYTGSLMLDGDLLVRFAQLPRPQQLAVAQRLGANGSTITDSILSDLAALRVATGL
ncbi:CPSF A subunit region-domain-containing protein [Haematococcus lacustris]